MSWPSFRRLRDRVPIDYAVWASGSRDRWTNPLQARGVESARGGSSPMANPRPGASCGVLRRSPRSRGEGHMAEIVYIPLADLLLDNENPRLSGDRTSQQEAALDLARQQGDNIVR